MKVSLFEVEEAIITLLKSKLDIAKVVIRDADFDISKQGWQQALVPDEGDDVHAVVISVVEYPQHRTGSDKEISPVFGIDFIRQYKISSIERKAFYDEFELIAGVLTQSPDLGLERKIAGHDELQGANIGTRTINGVKLRIFPTTLKVRLHPVDVRTLE